MSDVMIAGASELGRAREVGRDVALSLGRRRRDSGAPVRKLFVAALEPFDHTPPMADLLHGGRSGQVRLKLYLSVLWRTAKEPFEVSSPARFWAELLGLPDPGGNGERRIRQAMRDLSDRRLLKVRGRGGQPSVLQPLNDAGDGKKYSLPSTAYQRQKSADPGHLWRHEYFKIPSALWTEGYMAQLSGPGLAMLLVLLSQQRPHRPEVWIVRSTADQQFGLSERTRNKGLDELRGLDLISTEMASIDDQGRTFGFSRRRNVHTVLLK